VANDLAVRFLVAAPGQVDEVLAVLDEASAWLQGRGVEQWPSRFDPSWVEGAVRRAYYEAAGFVHRGDVTVAGAPGQRLDEGPVTVVSRYEQRPGLVS
jgi:hypothetical protein